MHRGAKARHEAELALPGFRLLLDLLEDGEDTAERAGIRDAALQRPADDREVAHIVVDRAAMVPHRTRERCEEARQEFLRAQIPEALGELRRADDVDEKEDALLLDGLMV